MSDDLDKIIELAERLKGLAENTSALAETVNKALTDVHARISNLEHAAALQAYTAMQPGPEKGRVWKLITTGKKLKLVVVEDSIVRVSIEAQE